MSKKHRHELHAASELPAFLEEVENKCVHFGIRFGQFTLLSVSVTIVHYQAKDYPRTLSLKAPLNNPTVRQWSLRQK